MTRPPNPVLTMVLAFAAGCGGIVNFTADGGGAGGGLGGGGPGGAGGGGVNVPLEACQDFCAIAPQCGSPDCIEECLSGFSYECPDAYAALLRCLAENVDASCSPDEDACAAELGALAECEAGVPCFNQGCSGSSEGCSCEGSCDGVPAIVECVPDVSDPSGLVGRCTCSLGGRVVGECELPTLLCQSDVSCCAQFF